MHAIVDTLPTRKPRLHKACVFATSLPPCLLPLHGARISLWLRLSHLPRAFFLFFPWQVLCTGISIHKVSIRKVSIHDKVHLDEANVCIFLGISCYQYGANLF